MLVSAITTPYSCKNYFERECNWIAYRNRPPWSIPENTLSCYSLFSPGNKLVLSLRCTPLHSCRVVSQCFPAGLQKRKQDVAHQHKCHVSAVVDKVQSTWVKVQIRIIKYYSSKSKSTAFSILLEWKYKSTRFFMYLSKKVPIDRFI